MKIGILTLPLHTNYGGILQAYALQTVLERMGHEVYVLGKLYPGRKISFGRLLLFYIKRLIKKIFIDHATVIFVERKINKERKIVQQYTDEFINKHIHIHSIKSLSDIQTAKYDALIVGSDQIWRPKYFCSWSDDVADAFLKFTEGWNVKRIAYAPSFGVHNWEYPIKKTAECAKYCNKFTAISVREKSAVKLCKDFLHVNAQYVLDPTMLFDKEDYIQLMNIHNVPKSTGNLLCYILDDNEEKKRVIENIAKEKGLLPFYVNAKINELSLPVNARIQPSVESWIRGFYDAEFIVTDSFHACVFSIIFGKPFIVLGNKNRGLSRFVSLLDTFDLKEHLLMSKADYDSNCSYVIDGKSMKILQSMRNRSNEFLCNSLL